MLADLDLFTFGNPVEYSTKIMPHLPDGRSFHVTQFCDTTLQLSTSSSSQHNQNSQKSPIRRNGLIPPGGEASELNTQESSMFALETVCRERVESGLALSVK